MKKYLSEIFGVSAKIEKWGGEKKLPLYLRNKRAYFVLVIGETKSILMKNDSDDFNIFRFEKEIQKVEEYAELSVILWLEAVSTYQRNALIKNRISFIVPNSQIYAPELGMSLREFCAGKREKVEKLSAAAQFLLLYFMYEKKQDEKSQAELAKQLNMSAMNMSRAVQELQVLELLETNKRGSSKIVKPVKIGYELYQLSNKYMQSPIQKKIYVDSRQFDMDLPLAGESALSKQSMLNDPKHVVYAMDKKSAGNIPVERKVEPTLIADDHYVEIELWKYDPCVYAKGGLVDIVSLVQSLKEIEDERVEMQIEEMMEEYKW